MALAHTFTHVRSFNNLLVNCIDNAIKAQDEAEESDDIGKQLSPLGSNSSSVQDVADHGPPKDALLEAEEPGSSGGEMEEKSLTFSEDDSISIPKVSLSQEPKREGSSSANVSEVMFPLQLQSDIYLPLKKEN